MEVVAGHTPSAAGDNKTIRISNIPITISPTALQAYLGELDKAFGTIAEHSTGLYISLGPDASDEDCQRLQVATVTFSKLADQNVPSVLSLGLPGDTFEGVVDTHFRGLTPLNDPKDPVIDIIAVTGLAGHAFGSWRSRVSSEMWLRDLLPKDMEDNGYRARIFTYGYDTKLNGSHSHAGVDHYSKQFLEAVKGARSRNPTRPLILIGHSLGGLVIKEAMIESFGGSSEIENTLRSCAGMLLFSVPHKGLAESGLICMVHSQPNENLVRDLCGNSQFLRCLDQSFGHQMNASGSGMGPKIISFYETKDTKTVKEVSPGVWARCEPYVRMVTEQSVMHAVESGQYIPMDADHSSIVKFINRSDPHYQLVRRKLLEIALTISITQTEPKAQCKERIRICRWLSSGPFDEKHVEVSCKRQENTGGWLLAHHQFISWMGNSGPRLLWGCGIPKNWVRPDDSRRTQAHQARQAHEKFSYLHPYAPAQKDIVSTGKYEHLSRSRRGVVFWSKDGFVFWANDGFVFWTNDVVVDQRVRLLTKWLRL
ncbi:hypothetical protein DFP73DRAFT_563574 [Morchella snyderi]|nr:hypothetical protein DFP73DRAFT_563574 [Morchella snyderi]